MKFDEGKFAAKKANPQDRQVSEDDVRKIFTLDAVYVNKYYITMMSDGTIRICFSEIDPSGKFMEPKFVALFSPNAFASFAQLVGDNMQHLAKMHKAAENLQSQLSAVDQQAPTSEPQEKAN